MRPSTTARHFPPYSKRPSMDRELKYHTPLSLHQFENTYLANRYVFALPLRETHSTDACECSKSYELLSRSSYLLSSRSRLSTPILCHLNNIVPRRLESDQDPGQETRKRLGIPVTPHTETCLIALVCVVQRLTGLAHLVSSHLRGGICRRLCYVSTHPCQAITQA